LIERLNGRRHIVKILAASTVAGALIGLGLATAVVPAASAEDPYICKTPAALKQHDCPTVSPFNTVPPNRDRQEPNGLLGGSGIL
jgi:hypothetical protein